LSFHKESFT